MNKKTVTSITIVAIVIVLIAAIVMQVVYNRSHGTGGAIGYINSKVEAFNLADSREERVAIFHDMVSEQQSFEEGSAGNQEISEAFEMTIASMKEWFYNDNSRLTDSIEVGIRSSVESRGEFIRFTQSEIEQGSLHFRELAFMEDEAGFDHAINGDDIDDIDDDEPYWDEFDFGPRATVVFFHEFVEENEENLSVEALFEITAAFEALLDDLNALEMQFHTENVLDDAELAPFLGRIDNLRNQVAVGIGDDAELHGLSIVFEVAVDDMKNWFFAYYSERIYEIEERERGDENYREILEQKIDDLLDIGELIISEAVFGDADSSEDVRFRDLMERITTLIQGYQDELGGVADESEDESEQDNQPNAGNQPPTGGGAGGGTGGGGAGGGAGQQPPGGDDNGDDEPPVNGGGEDEGPPGNGGGGGEDEGSQANGDGD